MTELQLIAQNDNLFFEGPEWPSLRFHLWRICSLAGSAVALGTMI